MGYLRLSVLGVLALCLVSGAAQAETKIFKATLSGASEVPPTTSAGTGAATATLDTATGKLVWDVTYSGLTGAALAAHIHGPADPGQNAGVMVPLKVTRQPDQGLEGLDRSADGRRRSREILRQHSHGGE